VFDPGRITSFIYRGYEINRDAGVVTCTYSLDDEVWFTETVSLGPGGNWDSPGVDRAARLIFLLAAISYYKAAAPPVIDLGDLHLTPVERRFLAQFYFEGLGEFAYNNDLDLSSLHFVGDTAAVAEPVRVETTPMTPLVPFGGGIDSIVSVERLRVVAPDISLFVVSRPGDRFEAIETAAAVTGLPVVRVGRQIDQQLLQSRALGFLNGHVPITGILSAIGILTAVVGGHDALIMSNEWSASIGNLEVDGRVINHQYSKSMTFESSFRAVLAEQFTDESGTVAVEYFSLLRADSELRIAREFAGLEQYHAFFRSCNRAFQLDPAARLDHWCGHCDKCVFIDLILSPFMSAESLASVFSRTLEPLRNPELRAGFERLLGNSPDAKPFECVGEINECRAAARQALERPDRVGTALLTELVDALPDDIAELSPEQLLEPISENNIASRYRAPHLD